MQKTLRTWWSLGMERAARLDSSRFPALPATCYSSLESHASAVPRISRSLARHETKMGTSNTRFLLGLILGAVLGGILGQLLFGSSAQTTLANSSMGLSPGDVDSTPATDGASSEGQLPAMSNSSASERRTARSSQSSKQDFSVADGEVQSLVAGLAAGDTTRDSGEGAIWGKVVDQDGEPLGGVLFRLAKSTPRTSGYSSSTVGAEAPEYSTLEDTVRKAAEGFYASQANRFETLRVTIALKGSGMRSGKSLPTSKATSWSRM
jgi:hypothetical protein